MTANQSSRAAVELIDVGRAYDDTWAVHHINLTVGPGEFIVLLGPSGCGKSTLLKMIAGIEEVTEGEIFVEEEFVNYLRPRDRDIAMVFQNYALYPHMTVQENLAFPLRHTKGQRLSKPEIARITLETATLVGLEDYLQRKPAQLSGGQRQRVALGRAIIRNPSVFLMDEPLSNLDARLRTEMRHSLMELVRTTGHATIYVTHDQVEAMTMADRVVVLNAGEIQQIGSPEEIFESPVSTFVARFIGSPPMTILPCEAVSSDAVSIGGHEVDLDGDHGHEPGESLSIGIRPSDVSLVESQAQGSIPGRCTEIEYLGTHSYIDVEIAQGLHILVQADRRPKVTIDDLVDLWFDPRHVHLFDAQGIRISSTRELGGTSTIVERRANPVQLD